MKQKLPLIAAALLIVVLGIGAFFILRPKSQEAESTASKRQIINALPYADRPFVTLFPHESNKLITLFLEKPGDIPELTIDLEYLSGNALKGGRTTIKFPVALPYTQAFLLGSCSSGGKCSFDTDITTGTIKTKIEKAEEVHVLKSNYVFVDGESATTDQKLKFSPAKTYKGQSILAYTHGYLNEIEQEVVAEPFVITSSSPTTIQGTLTFTAPDATKLLYFDGSAYKEMKFDSENGQTIDLNLKPWSKTVTIIRDDLKGAEEETTLYLVGPFVPIKE